MWRNARRGEIKGFSVSVKFHCLEQGPAFLLFKQPYVTYLYLMTGIYGHSWNYSPQILLLYHKGRDMRQQVNGPDSNPISFYLQKQWKPSKNLFTM